MTPFSLVEIYVRCGFHYLLTRSSRVLVGKLVMLRDRPPKKTCYITQSSGRLSARHLSFISSPHPKRLCLMRLASNLERQTEQ
jgi:hypothetical protein